MQQNVVEANRQRDLFLTDTINVWLLPQGWCDDFSVAAGFVGGLDYVDEEDGLSPEIYCYAPIKVEPNSECDTVFVRVSFLQDLGEVSEAEAKLIHPALFDHLDQIRKDAEPFA